MAQQELESLQQRAQDFDVYPYLYMPAVYTAASGDQKEGKFSLGTCHKNMLNGNIE